MSFVADAVPLLVVLLVCGVAATLLIQRERRKVTALEVENEALERHIRTLDDQNRELDQAKRGLSSALEALEARHSELESEKAAVAAKLAALETENESLRARVIEFQGHWSRQLQTVEEEIATVIRQLGEFRKGTVLPIPDGSKKAG